MMYLSQSSETMDARAQCVQHDLEDDEAEKLLRRVLAVLSRDYGIHMWLNKYITGDVCISATEPIMISVICLNSESSLFFTSCHALLDALLQPKSIIHINSLSHHSKDMRIEFSARFGTSIEELKVKLDLAE